ncbi:MAG: LCP family protein [Anaerolineales bacterium]
MKINFKPTIAQIIVSAVALALFVGVFIGVNYLISTWCITPLPGDAVSDCKGNVPVAGPTLLPGQTPDATLAPSPTPELAIPKADLPAAWDGASRVNVLVLGLDTAVTTDANGNILPSSADRTGPPHSDTMIVLTLDPQTKTAGMISIPRDLWVSIPGFGYSRINTAYADGVGAKLPGGGPALAMKTVEQVLGVPIKYYAQIDFWAFAKFIDDIGKIHVYVPKKIIVDPIGPGNDKWMFSVDWHWMNGARALAYVRNRHTANGDVDRSQRQQDVIMAIRDRVLSPDNLPLLVTGAPAVYKDLQAGIDTNLTFDEMLKLALLAKDVPLANIKRGLIDQTMFTFGNTTLGGQAADVLKPIPDKIRELRDTIFATGGAVSPLAKGANALDLAKQEGASVIVLNGTGIPGLDIKTGSYLKSLGINVINNGTASQNPAVTKVIDHTGRPYMLKYLKELFGLSSSSQITSTYDPNAPADIEIILGGDWALKNPMP